MIEEMHHGLKKKIYKMINGHKNIYIHYILYV